MTAPAAGEKPTFPDPGLDADPGPAADPALDADPAWWLRESTAAARVLDGVARRTRVVRDAGLSASLGVPVWLKCEHEQHTGSFKLRGAYYRVATAAPATRARGVVAASAGNHAQGVAYAAAVFGVPATIFVPAGANPVKVARTRRLGARVEEVPGGVEAALAAAASYAAAGGRLLVHPFDDPAVVAGQGTIGLELLDQVPDLGTVLVGVGGGGLVSGVAAALRARRPDVRVVGVQSVLAPAFAASLRAGRRLVAGVGADLAAAPGGDPAAARPCRRPTLPRPAAPTPTPTQAQAQARGTIADGIAVREPGRLTLALARRLVDDVVTVDEAALWEAMFLLRRAGHAVEPAGAAPVAALLRYPGVAQGPTVAVLSGGNLDPAVAARVASLTARLADNAGVARTTA
ncbi:L-threonine ammonia-lyase [Frankia canadensis]|uniref:threonine ammonia-lyase n=1 Tax=Frankia canadensis TaxID=1836972 RepID=A0A2I2KQJ9_9ACTN|nr:threonine/serine dehydratase [Frankia canadensis]SNQ47942.1 L-threonine ammonia-lyase [Frankia canadensis]SOU55232.1 L-threonine ammonia-lyase [Frankia canadensis]